MRVRRALNDARNCLLHFNHEQVQQESYRTLCSSQNENCQRSPTSSPIATQQTLVFFASLLLCVSHSEPPRGMPLYLPIHETDCLSNARPRACNPLAIASTHACHYNSLIDDVVLMNSIGLKHGSHKHARLDFSVASISQIATALGNTRFTISARINLIQAIWQHHLSSQSN